MAERMSESDDLLAEGPEEKQIKKSPAAAPSQRKRINWMVWLPLCLIIAFLIFASPFIIIYLLLAAVIWVLGGDPIDELFP